MESEARHSINWLKLQAVHLALLHFHHKVFKCHVLVRTDNMITKAYINQQGQEILILTKTKGTRLRSLMREAFFLFTWAEQSLLSVRVEHLAGIQNVAADWLSRQQLSDIEWRLHRQIFGEISEVRAYLPHERMHSSCVFSQGHSPRRQRVRMGPRVLGPRVSCMPSLLYSSCPYSLKESVFFRRTSLW